MTQACRFVYWRLHAWRLVSQIAEGGTAMYMMKLSRAPLVHAKATRGDTL